MFQIGWWEKLSEGIDISAETWKVRGRRSEPCKGQEAIGSNIEMADGSN